MQPQRYSLPLPMLTYSGFHGVVDVFYGVLRLLVTTPNFNWGRRALSSMDQRSNHIDFHDGSSYSDESAERRRQARAGVNAERAAELNKMIDSGDWTGVVAAANRFSGEGTSSSRSGGWRRFGHQSWCY